MDNPNKNDNKTCYNCGKIFRTPIELDRHKKRKTPCLIRDISEADLKNPTRCIYCNKIFSTTSNLKKHHDVCKVKNGGLQMLHDKVKHEETIRINKEVQDQKNKEFEEQFMLMKAQMEQQAAKIHELEAQNKALRDNNVINNTNIAGNNIVNNNTTNIQNMTVNNYNRPNTIHITDNLDGFGKLFKVKGINTPIELIDKIWYDPEHPENISIHLVNKKTGEILVIIDGRWSSQDIKMILPTIRQLVYEITQEMIRKHYKNLINEWNDMVPADIEKSRKDPDVEKEEYDMITKKIIDGREISKAYVKTAK